MKITQISTGGVAVFGLGDDGKVYIWNANQSKNLMIEWLEYDNATLAKYLEEL